MLEKILALLGITHDVAENTRETKTDIEDNKPKKRNYSFDDKTIFEILEEKKERKYETLDNATH